MTEQPPESPRLNALGKPLSPSYDPNYKIKTPLSSINRLRKPMPTLLRELPMNPDEEQRWRAVRECVKRGDKAKRKAEDFYITAGQHLNALKAEHTGTWAEWEIKVKERTGLGKSRASELMQIADGRKDVEGVRAEKAEVMRKLRAQPSPPRGGENAPEPEAAAEAKKTAPTKTIPSQVQRELEAKDAHIDELETAREHDKDLAEKLRAAEIKIAGLETEVEELKAENARLRAELEAKQETTTEKQVEAVMPKRGRGRPKGSTNKPKPPPAEAVAATDAAASLESAA
jgi:chromosome segregation ATPase